MGQQSLTVAHRALPSAQHQPCQQAGGSQQPNRSERIDPLGRAPMPEGDHDCKHHEHKEERERIRMRFVARRSIPMELNGILTGA
jgi:hypothetical protein